MEGDGDGFETGEVFLRLRSQNGLDIRRFIIIMNINQ
jgi:hypothetical protein